MTNTQPSGVVALKRFFEPVSMEEFKAFYSSLSEEEKTNYGNAAREVILSAK